MQVFPPPGYLMLLGILKHWLGTKNYTDGCMRPWKKFHNMYIQSFWHYTNILRTEKDGWTEMADPYHASNWLCMCYKKTLYTAMEMVNTILQENAHLLYFVLLWWYRCCLHSKYRQLSILTIFVVLTVS